MLKPPRFETEAEVEAYLWECVHVDEFVLQDEFVRVPSDLAYWNERYASAFKRWKQCKAMTEEVHAERSEQLRRELREGKQADPAETKHTVTVAEVTAAVTRDKFYRSAQAKEIEAEGEKVRLWGVLDAIRSKREMLISLGAHQRAEKDMWARD